MARRTQFGHEDPISRHAGLFQLVTRGRPDVEEPAVLVAPPPQSAKSWVCLRSRRHRPKPARDLVSAEVCCLDSRPNVTSHFVAARTDGWSDGDDEIGRTNREFARQRFNCRDGDPSGQPLSAGMGRSDGPCAAVGD